MHYDESYASLVMSRGKTSLSSFAPQKRNPSGSPLWLMTWFVSRSMSSSQAAQTTV
jgi:hypothetical protein